MLRIVNFFRHTPINQPNPKKEEMTSLAERLDAIDISDNDIPHEFLDHHLSHVIITEAVVLDFFHVVEKKELNAWWNTSSLPSALNPNPTDKPNVGLNPVTREKYLSCVEDKTINTQNLRWVEQQELLSQQQAEKSRCCNNSNANYSSSYLNDLARLKAKHKTEWHSLLNKHIRQIEEDFLSLENIINQTLEEKSNQSGNKLKYYLARVEAITEEKRKLMFGKEYEENPLEIKRRIFYLLLQELENETSPEIKNKLIQYYLELDQAILNEKVKDQSIVLAHTPRSSVFQTSDREVPLDQIPYGSQLNFPNVVFFKRKMQELLDLQPELDISARKPGCSLALA